MPDHLYGSMYLTNYVCWKHHFIIQKLKSHSGGGWENLWRIQPYLATIIMSGHKIFTCISQCKHMKAIVTICCVRQSLIPLIPYLWWWRWSVVLGFSPTCDVCHAVLPRNPSHSSDWGQQLLSRVFFFLNLHNSHSFVTLWLGQFSLCSRVLPLHQFQLR